MHNHLDRNLIGYGPNPPDPQWPGEARIAVSFVLNYEEGGENTILNGDAASEVFLTETPGGTPIVGGRDLSTELMYEYGSRAGFWRILRLFSERNMRFTSWAVGRALELNPAAGKAMAEAGHEVASHGYRWINYKDFTLEQELDHMKKAVKAIADTAGKPPVGWYTGRFGMHTLVSRHQARRLPLFERFLQRRPALLGEGRRHAAPDHPLHARSERHEVRRGAGLHVGRRLAAGDEGQLRRALRRGR